MTRIGSSIKQLEKLADAALGGEVSIVVVFDDGNPDWTAEKVDEARSAFRREHGPQAKLIIVTSRIPEPLPLPRAFRTSSED